MIELGKNGRRQQISIEKCSTSDQPRVKGKFVKRGTASRSNRLKYFNKVYYDLSKGRGTEHLYSHGADDF